MKDAVDGTELTGLDLEDLESTYGFPYMVIHRSDLHGIFLRACERAGVELVTDQTAVGFENTDRGARVTFADGHVEEASVVIAAGRRPALGCSQAPRRRPAGQQRLRRLPRGGADRAGARERHL